MMGKNGEWDKGRYDTNAEEVSPTQLDEEFYVYWSQRTQKDRENIGSNHSILEINLGQRKLSRA